MKQNTDNNSILRFLAVGLTLAITLPLFSGCGGGRVKAPREDHTSCNPSDLQYRPQSGGALLEWNSHCGPERAIKGYNFYVTPEKEAGADFPGANRQPHNRIPYPGDTNPDRLHETGELEYLEDGVTYLAAVGILFPDGARSKPSNVIRFTPMPSGEITLVRRYKGKNDGFSFANGDFSRSDNSENDLYFITKDGHDYLASPDKLGFGLRETKFLRMYNWPNVEMTFGRRSDALPPRGAKHYDDPAGMAEVVVGEVFDLLTADNHYTRIRVATLEGKGDDRSITLEYFYQTVAGMRDF